MPRVSVVVPNFNHARFLDRRLTSVLSQTLRDVELLFLDDASTDDSLRVFDGHAPDPRVRCIRNDTNSGSAFAQWNRGVAAATGELVWIAESDDDADARLLERLVAALDANPRVGLAFCQSVTIDGAGEVTGSCADWTERLWPGRFRADFVNDGRDEIRRHLLRLNTIFNASAVVFRREAFRRAGGADTTFRLCGDWMTWISMLLESDVAFVAEPLNRFRLHEETVRHRAGRDGVLAEEAYRVTGRALRALGADDALVEEACEARMAGWMQFVQTVRAPVEAHRRIFSAAKEADPRIRRRLAKALARHGLDRAGLLGPVLAAARRVSSTRGRARS